MQELSGFIADMERLAGSIGGDLTEPLEACREHVATGISAAFDNRSSPEGNPWLPRAFDMPHPILQETGALRAAATGTGAGHVERIENNNELVWGVDPGGGEGGVPGAAVHQFGATIVPVENQALRFEINGKEVFARQVTIPARPYLGFSDESAQRCGDTFADWLFEQAAEERS